MTFVCNFFDTIGVKTSIRRLYSLILKIETVFFVSPDSIVELLSNMNLFGKDLVNKLIFCKLWAEFISCSGLLRNQTYWTRNFYTSKGTFISIFVKETLFKFQSHLQHPGGHDPPHVRSDFSLHTFEVVGSGLVLVFCPQQSAQDPVSQQVWIPVGPPDGRPVPLTAQQLRFHLTSPNYDFNASFVCFDCLLRGTVKPNRETSLGRANNSVSRSTCWKQKRPPTSSSLVSV